MGGSPPTQASLWCRSQELQATGEEMLLGVSSTSWPPEGHLGAPWLLGVGEEPPLARESESRSRGSRTPGGASSSSSPAPDLTGFHHWLLQGRSWAVSARLWSSFPPEMGGQSRGVSWGPSPGGEPFPAAYQACLIVAQTRPPQQGEEAPLGPSDTWVGWGRDGPQVKNRTHCDTQQASPRPGCNLGV